MDETTLRAAQDLANSFRAGAQLQPVQVPINLQFNEICVGVIPLVAHQFLAGSGEYVRKSGGWIVGGSPAGLVFGGAYSAARITANLIGNRARKARAEAEAAGQWQNVGRGTLYLTNQRFALQMEREWADLWYTDVRLASCTPTAIELKLSGLPPTNLEIPSSWYWFVMYTMAARGQVVDPPRVHPS